MTAYEHILQAELTQWTKKMEKEPSLMAGLSRSVQTRINKAIPEKVHRAITSAIKQMTRAVLFGAEFTSKEPLLSTTIEDQAIIAREKIRRFSNAAAAEGAVTGAGGILLGLADFPLWLTLKMKMLFELAAIFGRDTARYPERVFLLYIFELTFSSQAHRRTVFQSIKNWDQVEKTLPEDIHQFDWRSFQQEYRDYIDIAKLLQLIPGIGAPIGAVVNHQLTVRLGENLICGYHHRYFVGKGYKI